MPGTPIPTLATPRLTLRGHTREDFADCAVLWADPEVVRFIGGRPNAPDEVWARLLRYVGHWVVMGYGYWVVRETASLRFIGEVGLADFRRELDPPFGDAPEIGWVLAPWAHGSGFATEAVAAALAWTDAHLSQAGAPVRTVCMVDPDNRPSLRVAEKSGYREYARTTYKGEAVILLER